MRFPPSWLIPPFLALPSTAFAAQCPGDDFLEENDTCATAVALPADFVPGLVAQDTDDDYFTYVVPDGEELTAQVFFAHVFADVDLRLYDEGCADLLDSSTGTTDVEEVVWRNLTGAPRAVVLHVFVAPQGGGSGCTSYDAFLTHVPIGVGTSYCESGANSTGQAATIVAGGSEGRGRRGPPARGPEPAGRTARADLLRRRPDRHCLRQWNPLRGERGRWHLADVDPGRGPGGTALRGLRLRWGGLGRAARLELVLPVLVPGPGGGGGRPST